jgi:hypothetical protein
MTTAVRAARRRSDVPIIAIDLPVMYEDEGLEEMGDTDQHTITIGILHTGANAHFAGQHRTRPRGKRLRAFANLNLYYHPIDLKAYVSPDVMVVQTARPISQRLRSYRVGVTGPAPLLTAEVLSERSSQQQDLSNKPKIYAELGVQEYVLVDVTGEYLPEKLLLKRLKPDGTWKDESDGDGGVTSRLGFRLIIDRDGELRVVDAATGTRYVRPDEAQAEAEGRLIEAEARRIEAEARQKAEARVKQLERELERLRGRK